MAKTFTVLQIIPTTNTTPGKIVIAGDHTAAFTGQFYLTEDTNTHHPFYEDQPNGTRKIDATTFKLVDNPRFAGRYTVRTPQDNTLEERDRYLDGGNTVIQVNELIKPLGETEDTTPLTYGTIIDISTFIIETVEETIYIYPKSISKVLYLDLPGHGFENWGEIYTQNLVDMMFNHATTVEPRDVKTGQLWFDLDVEQLKIWSGNRWIAATAAPPRPKSYLHANSAVSNVWIIEHDLDAAFPHILGVQVYADRGYGPELIAPKGIAFNNSNQLTITFSEPVKGWAKILS